MAAGLELLTSLNITRVAQALQDVTTLPQPLLFYERAAKVQTTDDEITMREKSYVFAADILAPDSKSLSREAGEFTFETTKIAKVKHNFTISESHAQLLKRIENSQSSQADLFAFDGYIARNTSNLLLGIKQREESMIIGMLLDGYTYDRLGIKLSGTWDMPAAFKVNPAISWDDITSKPISDLINLKVYASKTYGEVFNRVTMSYTALQNIIKTTEFLTVFKAFGFKWEVPDEAIITADPNRFTSVIGTMIGMKIEVYDGMYREYQSNAQIIAPTRFLPENIVLLTNSNDDNSATGWDFAQGQIMESVIGNLGGTAVIGGSVLEGYGPIAYATQIDPRLDPPGIAVYAVDRGAPRKHRPTCSAKIIAWN